MTGGNSGVTDNHDSIACRHESPWKRKRAVNHWEKKEENIHKVANKRNPAVRPLRPIDQ